MSNNQNNAAENNNANNQGAAETETTTTTETVIEEIVEPGLFSRTASYAWNNPIKSGLIVVGTAAVVGQTYRGVRAGVRYIGDRRSSHTALHDATSSVVTAAADVANAGVSLAQAASKNTLSGLTARLLG